MGDLNTDPVLFDGADAAVAVWNAWVGPGLPFHTISTPGEPKDLRRGRQHRSRRQRHGGGELRRDRRPTLIRRARRAPSRA